MKFLRGGPLLRSMRALELSAGRLSFLMLQYNQKHHCPQFTDLRIGGPLSSYGGHVSKKTERGLAPTAALPQPRAASI